MTTTEIQPAFDPTLQPIGYALAAELLTVTPPSCELAVGRDLFGWELATAHPTQASGLDAADRRVGSARPAHPIGATLLLPTI